MIRFQNLKLSAGIFIICFFILSSIGSSTAASPSNRIKDIRFETSHSRETAIIYLERASDFSQFVLHSPERIVVDIKAVVPQVNIEQNTDGTLINRIRAGQNSKDTARIVLDINENRAYEFHVNPQNLENKHVIEISATNEKIQNNNIALLDTGLPNDIFAESAQEKETSDFSISGEIKMRGTMQVRDDPEIENNTSLRNRILIETNYKNRITLSALSDYLYFGSENRTDEYDFTLHEAKWVYTGQKTGFFLGKQIRRWGKTDQISPVDTLNPQDMREFIIPDYEERKIPVWMGGINLLFDHFTLEGVVIPFFEESKFDYFQTNWAIFRHLKKEIHRASVSPELKSYFNNMGVHEQKPANESEWGLRLSGTIKEIDYGFTFHRTIEDNPYFKSFPVKNIHINGNLSSSDLTSAVFTEEDIEVEYKRANIAGFAFETVLGSFGLRGEAAWQDKESFITSSFTSVRKPSLFYIIGADHTTEKDIYFNIQFAHKYISDYDPDTLYLDRNTYALLGEVSRDIVSDWLEGSMDYYFTLNNDSWYISPHLTCTYITNLKAILGTFIFSGEDTTWIGRYKNNDLIYMDISYQF